jgi:hypothetical protein
MAKNTGKSTSKSPKTVSAKTGRIVSKGKANKADKAMTEAWKLISKRKK